MSEQLRLIKEQKWIQKLSDVDIEIFNFSYYLHEEFGDTEDCVIFVDDYISKTGYNDIRNFIKTVLYQSNYIKEIDYKEIRVQDAVDSACKKKTGRIL